jgi:hypothetical protein
MGLVKGTVIGVLLHKAVETSSLTDALSILTPGDLSALTKSSSAMLDSVLGG